MGARTSMSGIMVVRVIPGGISPCRSLESSIFLLIRNLWMAFLPISSPLTSLACETNIGILTLPCPIRGHSISQSTNSRIHRRLPPTPPKYSGFRRGCTRNPNIFMTRHRIMVYGLPESIRPLMGWAPFLPLAVHGMSNQADSISSASLSPSRIDGSGSQSQSQSKPQPLVRR